MVAAAVPCPLHSRIQAEGSARKLLCLRQRERVIAGPRKVSNASAQKDAYHFGSYVIGRVTTSVISG